MPVPNVAHHLVIPLEREYGALMRFERVLQIPISCPDACYAIVRSCTQSLPIDNNTLKRLIPAKILTRKPARVDLVDRDEVCPWEKCKSSMKQRISHDT